MKLARCHVLVGITDESLLHGAREVEDALRREVDAAGLTDEVQIVETGDLGSTGRGVVLVVYPDRVTYAGVTPADAAEIVSEHLLKGRPVRRLMMNVPLETGTPPTVGLAKPQPRIVLENCGQIDPESLDEAIAAGAYAGLERIITEQISPAAVISEVTRACLRGRGGAGFPTGKKWTFTAPGDEKYLICNADEGEPGTFKDRLILEGDPHRLIEGMIIAGYAIGAKKGYVYIRGEYALSIERMRKAIDQAYAENLLGANILGSGIAFDIEIKKGAGAYVCGEETALIESIEGRRGYPRLKPPFPGIAGLWGKPTVVNNVETLANVPPIIVHGADWFHSYGTETCPGTKVFTILGHVAHPGLIEVEMGTTLRTIITEYAGGMRAGHRFKGALLGGAAGGFLGPDELDIPLDFDTVRETGGVLGSGAILVLDDTDSIVELLHGILRFFAHESCGQCTPCRVGTVELVSLMERIRSGSGTDADLNRLVALAVVMQKASFCPLGQSPIIPISTALTRFPQEFSARVPTGV